MKFLSLLAALPATHSLATPPASPDYIFANPPGPHAAGYKIPTSYESAVMGRRILALTPLGDLSTTFPVSSSNGNDGAGASERRPAGMEGQPIALMDYVAACEDSGNPTLLAIRIATTFKNAAAGSNVSLSLRWAPPYPPAKRISLLGRAWRAVFPGTAGTAADRAVRYSAANLPRMALQGYLEAIEPREGAHGDLARCFVERHPDARYWLPGNRIHESAWARLVVEEVYWIGGFGDRAFIGWIPIQEWRAVTKEEWMGIKLPGEEKGWKEWGVGGEEL